ncbi:MAG: GIY-YIG nuclease family protein [Rhodospirillaceae bacterium]
MGPGLFPSNWQERENLSVPGIYLRIKQYESDRLVAYVGQSVNLLSRFDQHLRDMMSLSVTLRDNAGNVVIERDNSDRLLAYNQIDKIYPLLKAEVSRLNFVYAKCGDDFPVDYLKLVEALLKNHLEARVGDKIKTLENRQNISLGDFPEPVIIYSEGTSLRDTCAGIVNNLMGGDPIRYSPPDWMADI